MEPYGCGVMRRPGMSIREQVIEEIARKLSQHYGFGEDWWDKAILWAADMKPMFLARAQRLLRDIPALKVADLGAEPPSPDPHSYEGEFEAICATKEAIQKDGWFREARK